jgi:F-type H+-transporting ATPase subunit delta
MRPSGAAKRYARALFSLARDEGRIESVREELASFAALLEKSTTLRDVLLRPLYPAAQRTAVLEAVAERLGASPLLRKFFALLIQHRRIVEFAAVLEEFDRLADLAAGRVQARVASAAPLSDAQRDRLRAALAARTGSEVRLEVEVDPGLLGGVVAKVGDLVYDGSLRTQLQQLRANLTKGQ